MKTVRIVFLLAALSRVVAQDASGTGNVFSDGGIPAVQTIAPTKGEAVAAILAVPPKYNDGILEVTGQGGEPNPAEWIIQAWNTEDPGTVHKLTIRDDQFVSDVLSVNIFEAERKAINIPLPDLRLDSGAVYRIAQSYASANGRKLGRVNYMLTVRAKHTPPIWTLDCFDGAGAHIGKLEILATSGEVTASPGFKVSPR